MGTNDIWLNAYHGSLVADALAMPVHWYYDTAALRRDYGVVDRFLEQIGRAHV